MIFIRPAEFADIGALQQLDTVAQQNPRRADAIVRWVSNAKCLCAVNETAICGYAVIDQSFFGQPMLEMVMVAEPVRGQGIGSLIIQSAIATTPGPVLWSSTNQSNATMQRLFSALGFVKSGYVEGLDEGDPEIIYRFVRKA